MTGFSDREKDFENKYAHDEKINFKIEARAAKLFGLWAADKQGISGAEAQAYAMDVVSAKLEGTHFEGALKKVTADFAKHGVDITDHIIKANLDKLTEEARQQVMNEGQ